MYILHMWDALSSSCLHSNKSVTFLQVGLTVDPNLGEVIIDVSVVDHRNHGFIEERQLE